MYRCVICGDTATLGDGHTGLCPQHEGLADLWGAVHGSMLSDWLMVDEPQNVSPDHREARNHVRLMTEPDVPPRLSYFTWQNEVARILGEKRVWLEDTTAE